MTKDVHGQIDQDQTGSLVVLWSSSSAMYDFGHVNKQFLFYIELQKRILSKFTIF